MATWIVQTKYKKSCEQREIFNHDDYKDPIIVTDGFRFCEYEIKTNDDEIPQFEFVKVDGIGVKAVDLNSCCENNIIESNLIEMFDGGCWGGTEFPDDMSDEERERLEEVISENGLYGIEEDGNGWWLNDSEVWVWGPLEISDENGNLVKVVTANSIDDLINVDSRMTIEKNADGFIVEINGRDSDNDYITVSTSCSKITEVTNFIKKYNKLELEN